MSKSVVDIAGKHLGVNSTYSENYDYDLLFPKNIKPKKEIPFLVKKLKRIGKKFKNKQIKKKNIQIYY